MSPADDDGVPRGALPAFVTGALLRLAFLLAHPPGGDLASDMAVYTRTARRLLDAPFGDRALEAADALYPAGTSVLLAGFMLTGRAWTFVGAAVWWFMSSCVPLLWARWAAARMTPRAATISTWLVATWPITLTWTGWFTSEVPALFGMMAVLVLLDEVRTRGAPSTIVGAGLVAGATLVVRPQTAIHLAVAGAPLVWRAPRRAAAAVAVSLVPVLLGAALVSWIAGEPFALSLSRNAGVNFFQGHCDVRFVRAGGRFVAAPPAVQNRRGVDVAEPERSLIDQGFWMERGRACIREDGILHARRLARNVADLGATSVPWPQGRAPWLRGPIDVVNTVFSGLVPLLLVVGLVLREGRPLALQVLVLVPLALVFYGDPRYRAMTDVFSLGIAAIAVDRLLLRSAHGSLRPPS